MKATTMTVNPDLEQTTEGAVLAVERLALGAANYDAVEKEAAAAIDALEASARADLFPGFVDATADNVAALEFNIFGARQTFDARVLAIHAAAISADHPVADIIRSAAMLDRVGVTLCVSVDDVKLEKVRVRAFARDIARQLVDAGKDDDGAASTLCEVVPAFEARLSRVRDSHAAHAREQQQLAEAAAARSAEQLQAARLEGLQDLRDWFNQHGQAMFNYETNNYSGVTVINGYQFQERVLAASSNGVVSDWRIQQAITARRTIEPNYTADWFTQQPKAAA